jgi:8-oxo-dGTP pyrophosphatase MutT (NUDIX family)
MDSTFQKLVQKLGTLLFWITWPALWLYIRGTVRTRVLFIHKKKILVVHNFLGDGKWSIPGGGVHSGETAEAGARREFNEELGLQASRMIFKPLATEQHEGDRFVYLCHYFVAELRPKRVPFASVQIKKQRLEILDYEWMDYKKLNKTNASPDVLRAIRHAKRLHLLY